MANRLILAFITVVLLLLMAGCSTRPVTQKTGGMSQVTPQRESTSKFKTLLPYPEDTPQTEYRSSEVFPRPKEIEPQVRFWQKVYAVWSRSQVAIHDKLHMNVIYEVVQLPGEVGESLTPDQKEFIETRLDDWKHRLGELEDKLVAGAPLNADEQGLVQQMEDITGDRNAIFGASLRLRHQRGLRERFKKGLIIGSRYERQYRDIFRRAGLPEDLAYLPHVESSFQYNARSSAGALGIWQFTAGAARMFMNGDDSAEARLDPIASTYGAARYLSHAYHKLGSWPLAVTSYNYGIGGMQRAKDRFGHDFPRIVKEYDHPQFGFASRNYYAEFLAARDIAREPERFFPEGLNGEGGISVPDDDSVRTFAVVSPSLTSQDQPEPLKVASAEPIAASEFIPTTAIPKLRSTPAARAVRGEPLQPVFAVPTPPPHGAAPPKLASASRAQPVLFKNVSAAQGESKKIVWAQPHKAGGQPNVLPKAARVDSGNSDIPTKVAKRAVPASTRPEAVHPRASRPASLPKGVTKIPATPARAMPTSGRAERRPEAVLKSSSKPRLTQSSVEEPRRVR